jgi:iron complex outermembrane receptor protein
MAQNVAADEPKAPTERTLDTVVVTATRAPVAAFDIPASISRLDRGDIQQSQPLVNISESLSAIPGIAARDRQNYAQDVQVSIRGFGTRASFGIRGVRLYIDGIPATMPDGQGQIANADLASAERIEVLRGPFSALYGNSSGGVLQVFTEDGKKPLTLTSSIASGSDAALRYGAKVSGASDAVSYVISGNRFTTDGYRDHSDTERTLANAKVSWQIDPNDKLTFIGNRIDMPEAQDPLGLTRDQFESDPRGVDQNALRFNTRKSVEQTQGGLLYEHAFAENLKLTWSGYYGERSTVQFQSIPTAAQGNPRHPGGVIDLERNYGGTDARLGFATTLLGRAFTLTGGVAYDRLKDQRRGFENFVGTQLGVQGALRRDEDNTITNLDPYVQSSWQILEPLRVDLGVRYSRVEFEVEDNYIVGVNGDDSGSRDYSATLPVLGVLYKVTPALNVYAAASRGFETPTANELAYQADGTAGLNLNLRPARSDNVELGVKTRLGSWAEASVAAFTTRTEQEIVTQANVGGRSSFRNAGDTRRRGIELQAGANFGARWQADLAYTLLDAEYRDSFATCAGTPCTTPNQIVAAGRKLPGVARNALAASVGWQPLPGWRAALEGQYLSRVFVNDANADAAPDYALTNLSVGYELTTGSWKLDSFVRVDNLFDRRYAGSVIVNEGNSRFFEPAPGRTWLAGFTAAFAP